MKKLLAILVALTMAFGFVAACGGDSGGGDSDLIKVAIINNPPSESGYREANVRDMEAVFTAANGYDVQTFYNIDHDPQINAARGFIAEGVDVLLISAAQETGWDSVLQDAQDAGIRVFLFDRMINTSLFEAAVVSDMHNQGRMAVEVLEGLGLPEYNIIHIQGAMGSAAQVGRTEPFMEKVNSDPNWNIVVQQTATWDEDTARQIVESVIASGDAFNVVYAENDGMAAGAVAALGAAGISHGFNDDGSLRDVVIIGVDANKWALRELQAGNWNFNIQCSPFQAQIIHEIIQGIRSVTPGEVIINPERYFDARTITDADIAQYGLGDDPGGATAAVTLPADISSEIRVAIINNPPSESGYREANVKDMEEIFTAANGYEVQTFYNIDHDPQINAARGFIAEGVDVLLISAAQETGWDSVLQDAAEAGIRVFLFDRMIQTDLFEAAVVSDMHNQGRMAVEVLEGLGLDEYNIIHIQGAMGSAAQVGRTEPFIDKVNSDPNWNIVVQQTATWDEDTARQIVESVITSGDSFNVVYAENDGMAAGAVAALQAAGISHGFNDDGSVRDVVIIGVDANRWALRELLAKNWNFNIQCSPFQAQIIHEIIQGIRPVTPGEIIINPERYFDARTITQAEIDQFGLGD